MATPDTTLPARVFSTHPGRVFMVDLFAAAPKDLRNARRSSAPASCRIAMEINVQRQARLNHRTLQASPLEIQGEACGHDASTFDLSITPYWN